MAAVCGSSSVTSLQRERLGQNLSCRWQFHGSFDAAFRPPQHGCQSPNSPPSTRAHSIEWNANIEAVLQLKDRCIFGLKSLVCVTEARSKGLQLAKASLYHPSSQAMSVKLDMLVEVEEQASDKSLSSDADSDSSMLAFVPPIPPSLPKFVAATLFTACLNWADFFSDWYVVLQYACIINSDMTAGCGSGELQACEAHPWWFATGLSLLVISNLVQSCFWAFGFFFFLEEQAWGRFPATFSGQLALSLLLILLAFAQLHYLVDIAAACIVGAPDPEDRIGRYFAMIFRDMAMKILESGPQLYLQSYILFAVGSHGDPVKLASVAISIAALGHGVVKGASTIWSHLTAALSKTVYWMMTFLWFSSDQALKSAGYALVLAPGARPYGMALMAIAALASCGLTIHSDNPKHVWLSCSTVVRGMLLFFAVYLVPCLALAPLKVVPALLVRWVENAACALLAYSFAVTSCGHAPTNEVLGLFGLLLFNVLCYLIRYFCFDHETGDFLCFGRGTLQEEGGKEGPKNLNTRPSTTCEAAAASRKFSPQPC